MADHRNNPLMFVPMRPGWEAERLTLLRSTDPKTNPAHCGRELAVALKYVLDTRVYTAFEAQIIKQREERQDARRDHEPVQSRVPSKQDPAPPPSLQGWSKSPSSRPSTYEAMR